MQLNVLIRFTHGLGDSVQASVVLKHLRRHRPAWNIDVRCGRGKHTALVGLCRKVYHDQDPEPKGPYDKTYSLGWYENYNRYLGCPNTKVTNCLKEVFGLDWDEDLGRYEIQWPGDYHRRATEYLLSCGCTWDNGRLNAVVVHYQGNTSQEKKNLSHEEARALCQTILDVGCVPIILDWDKRSPLPDGKRIFNPGVGPGDLWGNFGSGDAAMIAALISQASLFIGVDSGPQKSAAATDTPSIGVWTKHSVVQFMDPAPNFLHLVDEDWRSLPPCNDERIAGWFTDHYAFQTYAPGRLVEKLCSTALRVLGKERRTMGNLVEVQGFWAPQHRPEQSAVIIQDVYYSDAYKTHLRPKKEGVEYVVDLGANIGCFSRLWHERNPQARIVAVDPCPDVIEALRANVGSFAEVVHAACCYSTDVWLLNSFTEDGLSTGGSRVVDQSTYNAEKDRQYSHGGPVLDVITLEQIMKIYEFPRIDVLKLDVEGSEFDILEHCDLSRVGTIFIESHGHDRWLELMARKFPEEKYDIGHMSRNGEFSTWHIVNRSFQAP